MLTRRSVNGLDNSLPPLETQGVGGSNPHRESRVDVDSPSKAINSWQRVLRAEFNHLRRSARVLGTRVTSARPERARRSPVSGNPTWLCVTEAGSGWACASDRNQKQNLRQLDGQAVLERLVEMPVFAWNPKGRNAHVNHYGPTAQDFHAAFGLGDDDKLIGSQDADGVALPAIQGLNAKVEAERAAKDTEIAALRAELTAIRSLLATSAARSTQTAQISP